MVFYPFEVTIPHITYACLGGFVVLFGMFSLFLRERLYIGEACWAFLFGVIIGPYGANIFNPRAWGGDNDEVTNAIVLEFTRVVLAIGVFAIGVELPKAYMARHWKSILFLLVPVMTWGWFVSAGLIYALIPGLNFLSSLAVAACLTPTDPILAAAVVGGKWADKHVPAHIRHLLAAESGCNDGAAFPFLFIALYLTLDAPDTGRAIKDWFLLLWLYQVIVGTLIGAFLGFGFRHLMKFCQRLDLIDRHSYVAQYVSLALFTIGVCTLLGSDDLLAAFACGTAFAWDGFFNRQTEESLFSSVIDLLFNVAAFIFVGAWMPFSSFSNAELTLSVWRLIVIAILVLVLRRLPIMIALYKFIPDIKTFREAVFTGHFGPIGIGAIFISTLATEVIHKSHHGENHQIDMLANTIQPITAFMVLCSITVHGLSIPGVSLGRRVHSLHSRTWSRHATPDWTNQARLVTRGDDIVINRDSAMEQGDLSPDEKFAMEMRKREDEKRELQAREGGLRTPEKQRGDDGSLETKRGESSGSASGAEETRSEARAETPPDGTETRMEWQEPHHRVIERREGPGSDVDVEVTNQEDENPDLGSPIARLKRTLHNLEHGISRAEGNIEAEVAALEEKIAPSLSRRPSGNDDEEEGWASDRSSGNAPSTSAVVSASPLPVPDSPPKRSRSQKNKTPSPRLSGGTVSTGRRGRQRTSIKRGIMAHAQSFMRNEQRTDKTATSDDDDDEEDRGRLPTNDHTHSRAGARRISRPNSRPNTADSSVRNHRIDNIRALHSQAPTRDVSPSRSVRFVDAESPRSGPRPGAAQNDSSPGTPVEGVVGDELDTSRNSKVTFEIPKILIGGSGKQ